MSRGIQLPESFMRGQVAKGRNVESINDMADIARESLASAIAARINQHMAKFDKALDQNHEIGVRLVSFGQAITFHVEAVNYHNPILIIFTGVTENGQPVQMLQHVSQLSFLLTALPKLDPGQPKRPFGFHVPDEEKP